MEIVKGKIGTKIETGKTEREIDLIKVEDLSIKMQQIKRCLCSKTRRSIWQSLFKNLISQTVNDVLPVIDFFQRMYAFFSFSFFSFLFFFLKIINVD